MTRIGELGEFNSKTLVKSPPLLYLSKSQSRATLCVVRLSEARLSSASQVCIDQRHPRADKDRSRPLIGEYS